MRRLRARVRGRVAAPLLVLLAASQAAAQPSAPEAPSPAEPPAAPADAAAAPPAVEPAPAPAAVEPAPAPPASAPPVTEPAPAPAPSAVEAAPPPPAVAPAADGDGISQEELDRLANMSLEDLLSTKVVSASLAEEDSWEALAIISVITAEAMREYGHLSVGDALRYEAGMYPIYDWVSYNVGVRGVNGGMGAQSQVLRTMLDGRDIRFRPTGGSFFGPELVPRLAIRQIEIVRGPVSALYGADAFLGAINVIPNRAEDMGPGHARLELHTISERSNWGIQADGAAWGKPFDIDSILSVSYRDLERGGLELPQSSPSYDSLTDVLGFDSVPLDRERAASALGRLELGTGHGSVTLESNLQYFERGANFNFESSPLSDGRVSLYNAGVALRQDHSFEDRLRIRAFTSYDRGGPTERERLVDRFVVATIPYIERTLDYQTSESRAEITYTDPNADAPVRFSVTAGGDYTYDEFDTPSVTGIRPEPQDPLPLSPPSEVVRFHNGAGFLQLRLRFLEHLRALGGLRVEGHSEYGTQVSYRAGVGYADQDLAVRLLYGSSFKAPSAFLLYAEPVITGGPERNPDLGAQYAQTGELNVSYRLARWATGSITTFLSNIDDLARIETTGLTPRALNAADIVTYGAEAELRLDHQESGLEAFVNAAWAHAEEAQDDTTGRSSLYPEYSISAGPQLHWREQKLRFMALNRLVSPRAADPSNVVRNGGVEYEQPWYDLLSVGVYSEGLHAIDERDTELGLRFDNVLFTDYAEPGFLGVDIPGQSWSLRASVSQQL